MPQLVSEIDSYSHAYETPLTLQKSIRIAISMKRYDSFRSKEWCKFKSTFIYVAKVSKKV